MSSNDGQIFCAEVMSDDGTAHHAEACINPDGRLSLLISTMREPYENPALTTHLVLSPDAWHVMSMVVFAAMHGGKVAP